MNDDKYYVCFKLNKEMNMYANLCITKNKEEVSEWRAGKLESSFKRKKFIKKEVLSDSNGFDYTIKTFFNSMKSFKPAIVASVSVVSTVKYFYIHSRIFPYANSKFTEYESDGEDKIFIADSSDIVWINRSISRLRDLEYGSDQLPGTLLLGLTSIFDAFLFDYIEIMFGLYPGKLNFSDKKMSYKEIMMSDDIVELKKSIVFDEINNVMRKSKYEQLEYISNAFLGGSLDRYDRKEDLVEVYERRNLVAHSNGMYNDIYVKNIKKYKINNNEAVVGDVATINYKYLSKSSDLLLEFGISLLFFTWVKNNKGSDDQPFLMLNEICLELLRNDESKVASRLLKQVVENIKTFPNEKIKKMIIINLANSYKKMGNIDQCNDVLNGVDWSSSSLDFLLCKACLEDEIDKIIECMEKFVRTEVVSKEIFIDWPIFDHCRHEDKFKNKYFELFGENLDEKISVDDVVGDVDFFLK
tara:strand:- start:290 stop:1699 length:1410 start_codon:yes stop_codon:yes gene_type:complete